GPGAGVPHVLDGQAIFLRLRAALAAVVQRHTHLNAALLEVERVSVPLGPISHDGDLLAADQAQVGVSVITNLGHVFPRLLAALWPSSSKRLSNGSASGGCDGSGCGLLVGGAGGLAGAAAGHGD